MTATLNHRKPITAPPAPAAPPPPSPDLPALRLVPTSRLARRLGRFLLVVLILAPFVLLFVPWQQSCPADGRVIAYQVDERQQTVEAPIDGRVKEILVREYDPVKKGDLLVRLEDPNPNLVELLKAERQSILDRQKAARDRRESFEKQIENELKAKAAAVSGIEQRVRIAEDRNKVAEQNVKRAVAARDLAKEAFLVQERLRPEGLTPRINWVTAKQNVEDREAGLAGAQETANAARKEIDALGADRDRVKNEFDAKVNAVTALWQAAMAELASADRDLTTVDLRIGRQATQDVTAPVDGVVSKILTNSPSGGNLVKAGDPLLVIVPDIDEERDRVVELFLDGNDAPLVTEMWKAQVLELAREEARAAGLPTEGEAFQARYREMIRRQQPTRIPVRLQFEGYPAIQWVGWPSVAVGTFGGVVAFVDPHDDGKGSFRILVRPDPDEEATNPWPSGFSLRQGLRAKGWVQLNRVSLGWELWRRLNGFPPVVATKDPDKETKATKVRVPK